MTARRPSDPMGSRLWELEEGYCGESEHVDDLITLAWNIYHARDDALALAGRRGEAMNNLLAFMPDSADPMTWEFMDYGLPWMLSRDALVAMDECIDSLATPPPTGEDDGGGAKNGE